MEYFNSPEAAERYFEGRPDYHAGTINRAKDFLHLKRKVHKALDIACGTGLSEKALLNVAHEVFATDISHEMLNLAHRRDKIHYLYARAEKQPFMNDEFDLVTVSSGVHWFDIDKFLAEANRVLKPGGWLMIYENNFTGRMKENDGFKPWVDETYLQKFPSPPRNKNYDWSHENLASKNFSIHIPGEFDNEIVFNKGQLIIYFTTQSNVIAAVEDGRYTYHEVEQWLEYELTPYFVNDETVHPLLFCNRIKYLQKLTLIE